MRELLLIVHGASGWGRTSSQSRRFLGSERFMKTVPRPLGRHFESRAGLRGVNNSPQLSVTFITQGEGMIALLLCRQRLRLIKRKLIECL